MTNDKREMTLPCLNPACGKEIEQTPKQKRKHYCNDACRLQAHRKKMKSIPLDEWKVIEKFLALHNFTGKVEKKEIPAMGHKKQEPVPNFTVKPGKLKGESTIEYRIRMIEKGI